MRLTRYLGPAVAISVGTILLIGGVATHSRRGPDDDPAVTGPGTGTGQLAASVARAYLFLNQMMDRRTSGTTPRLLQSYLGGLLGLDGDTSSAIRVRLSAYRDHRVVHPGRRPHRPAVRRPHLGAASRQAPGGHHDRAVILPKSNAVRV